MTTEYEFGGPFGALMTMVSLPVVILFLYVSASHEYVLTWSSWRQLPEQFARTLCPSSSLSSARECAREAVQSVWSWQALAVVVGWILFQVALERLLPGEWVRGVTLSNGKRLRYKVNAHLAFWVSMLALVHWPVQQYLPLSWLYDNYLRLATASVAVSTALSVYVYVGSFARGKLLAAGGQSGNVIYDFFIGRELNPRLADFDIKYFCELRPGLIGWTVLNAAMMFKQMEMSESGLPSASMLCVNLFQALYVWDGLYQERAILTTMDITTDGFGFMLAFGDLAWVPFTYTLQARYLVAHDPALSLCAVAAVAALNLLGYAIFRGANSQKDQFRRDPDSLPHLRTLDTKRGTRLLISGWWGIARKINYTGDWIMGLSWCLVTGFDTIVTYFYAIYFAVLLIHRALRDDHACHQKYGDDWQRYKQHVPAIFIPWLI